MGGVDPIKRAVGGSENQKGGASINVVSIICPLPLVEIGLIDLLKSGGAMSLPASPAPTGRRPSACIAQGLGTVVYVSRGRQRLEGSLIEFSLRSCTKRIRPLFEVARISR